MTVVAGLVRVNRPYFFTDDDGNRAEFGAYAIGGGDLVGKDLAEYQMYVNTRQIETVTPVIPENTVIPTITGTAQVGQTLTASPGTWTGTSTPVLTYQWEDDGVEIVGATGSTLLLAVGQLGGVITVVVTGENASGTDSAESLGTAAVIAA